MDVFPVRFNSAEWNYGGLFDEVIKSPNSPLPSWSEARAHFGPIFARLHYEYIPLLEKITKTPLPPLPTSPRLTLAESLVDDKLRKILIALEYFTTICDAVEKNMTAYWKNLTILEFVNREIPRLRALLDAMQRVCIPTPPPSPEKFTRISLSALFTTEEERRNDDVRCYRPIESQLMWEEEQEEELRPDVPFDFSTTAEEQLVWNDDKNEDDLFCEDAKEYIRTESSASSESGIIGNKYHHTIKVMREEEEDKDCESDEEFHMCCHFSPPAMDSNTTVSSITPLPTLPSPSSSKSNSSTSAYKWELDLSSEPLVRPYISAKKQVGAMEGPVKSVEMDTVSVFKQPDANWLAYTCWSKYSDVICAPENKKTVMDSEKRTETEEKARDSIIAVMNQNIKDSVVGIFK